MQFSYVLIWINFVLIILINVYIYIYSETQCINTINTKQNKIYCIILLKKYFFSVKHGGKYLGNNFISTYILYTSIFHRSHNFI